MIARRELRIPIFDLGCGAGAATIEHELARAPGVLRVYVNPANDAAYVDYDPALTGPAELATAIERAGYRAGAPAEDR